MRALSKIALSVKLLAVIIWLTAYCLPLTAQLNNHIYVNRGETTYLTWKASGDYTGYDSLYFAVKACTTLNCGRLSDVSKSCVISYTAPYTTVTCTLYAANTSGLNAARYYYSIYAYGADTVLVTNGNFNLMLNGQSVADGVATTGPVHIIAVDSSAHEPGFLINRNSTNLATWISKDSTKSLLDVVDKSSSQNILAQKNFLGRTKYGLDTTISIDGRKSTLLFTPDKITIKDSNFIVLRISNGLGFGDFSMGTWNHTRTDSTGQPNQTLVFGWNVSAGGGPENPNEAYFAWEIESHYNGSFEPHWTFIDKKGIQRKPISLNLRKSDGYTVANFNFHNIRIKSPDNNSDFIQIYCDTTYGFGKRIILQDTIPIIMTVNNVDWLFQYSKEGAPLPLIKINDLNQTMISENGQSTLFGNSQYRYAFLSPYYQRFIGSLSLTQADYNFSTHADTALSLFITAPGYGIVKSKLIYFPTTSFVISQDNYTPVLTVDRASNELTFGPSYHRGTGSIYAGGFYATTSGGDYTDNVQFYSTSLTADNSIPSFYTEGNGVADNTTITSPDRSIAIRVNGTVFYIPAKITRD